jgi:hypothetical protein
MKEMENDREEELNDEGLIKAPARKWFGEEGEWLGEEELLALDRLMGPSRALEWLLEFAQQNLNNLSPGQWTDLSAELAVFSKYGPVATTPPSIAGWLGSRSMISPSRKEATAWQHLILAALNSLLDKGFAKFPPAQITGYIVYLKAKDKVSSYVRAKGREQSFVYHAFRSLEGEVRRIKRCEVCQRIYLADRKTQIFCSIKCQGRATQRRFVARRQKTKR